MASSVPLGGLAGRALDAPADPVQQHIQPGQRVVHPEPPAHQLPDPGQRPALIGPAPDDRPGVQHRLELAQLGRGQLAPAPPTPLEASACFPPTASARCHRLADIRDTRKRFAISRSLAPASMVGDRELVGALILASPANSVLSGQPRRLTSRRPRWPNRHSARVRPSHRRRAAERPQLVQHRGRRRLPRPGAAGSRTRLRLSAEPVA